MSRPRHWTMAVLCLAAAAAVAGCTMPQVVVLEDPLTAEEHLELGLAYDQQGKLDLAESHYRTARKKGETSAALYLANLLFSKGSYAEAEQFYREAIRNMPEDPRAYNNLAWMLYLREERLEEAESLARTALNLAPAARKSAYRDTLDKILQRRAATVR
jgi:tetratricopeptide (TPR) repeat protein